MPPKKKKAAQNYVVGTVSTRSTRRQSIVNIEIPKLSRSSKSTAKAVKESRTKITTEERQEADADDFFENFQTSHHIEIETDDNLPEPTKTEKRHDPDKDNDNRALLEILQDWEDDDEDQNETIPTPNSSKTDGNSFFHKNFEQESNSNISDLSENKQMELMLSEGLDEAEEAHVEEPKEILSLSRKLSVNEDSGSTKSEPKFTQEDSRSRDANFEALKDESSASLGGSVQTETEEVIIEENASVPYADDMLEDNTQTEEKTDDSIIHKDESTIISIQKDISTGIASEETVTVEIASEETISENISENNQPMSGVEQIRIICEDSPVAEEEIADNQEFEYQTPMQEDNSNLSTEELNKETNIGCSSEKTIDSEPLPVEEVEKMECEFETSNVGVEENNEINKSSSNGESESTPSNFSSLSQEEKIEIYEDLENKVAEMNLTDENTSKKVDEENIISSEEIKDEKVEELDFKNCKSSTKKEDKPKVKKEGSKQAKPPKFPKPEKEKPPKVKHPKTSKPPTFKINKDKKSKTKKLPSEKPPKKPKEKSASKEPDKSEKKVDKQEKKSDKKVMKFEEALGKVDAEGDEVRRSSRIKSISVMNRKTSGWGLVKSKSETSMVDGDVSDSNNSFNTESDRSTPSASPKVSSKERKSKSNPESPQQTPIKSMGQVIVPFKGEFGSKVRGKDPVVEARLKQFVHLKENLYKTDRMACKEAKKMVCDCFLTHDELENNEYGCGEDCLNRLLLIECGNFCTVGERCTNKRFQKNQFAPVEVFNTDKKGLGLRAAANIPFGEFILEYVGEVLNSDEFDKRAEVYSQDKNIHYYFMALRADAIIDATMKGNISRFINHSCDPNAETQKWTVNGELRIGFFSTRTILAGEEITFDYRFQRYGKEAQKCFCGASICRGWLGEQPDSDEDEEEDEEEGDETKPGTPLPAIKDEDLTSDLGGLATIKDEIKMEVTAETADDKTGTPQLPSQGAAVPATTVTPIKRKVQKKKPRIEMFEEVDQLNEEIEMLVTTGLKNQAHTLKLSRLMVRAKEPQQRAKLLRVLRRGELPCRRLFLDYHGLRFMHGYMIDAQQLVVTNKKYESLRLEMLQTLAVLPIPNKTMLQDSKVLSTVEKWSTDKHLTSPTDSESNSPKDAESTQKPVEVKEENKPAIKDEQASERSVEDQEEEIRFLATKLLEEWKNLKEVFRIPKKERIEQMKEHEREANKKFMQTNQNTYTEEERRLDRYRGIGRIRERDRENRRPLRPGDKPSAEFLRLSRVERRKLFALQHELKEEERKLKQREMWREHEVNCMRIGADPRFTAPFDPSRGYQYIWNQQMGQWQTLPIQSTPRLHPSQNSHINMPPPHVTKPILPGYQYNSPMSMQYPNLHQNPGYMTPLPPQTTVQGHMPPIPQNYISPLPQNPVQGHHPSMGPIPPLSGANVVPGYHGQTPIPILTPPLPQIPPPHVEEDPSQVKFMGPIPPPAKLPPKWKCAKDKYGRPYYYHIKLRKSQWEPPPPPLESAEVSESESSSESSTVSSDSSSENSDSDDDIDDTRLLIEVRRQMDSLPNLKTVPDNLEHLDDIPTKTPSPDEKHSESEMSVDEFKKNNPLEEDIIRRPSIDMRLKELDLFKDDKPAKKKRRVGLCEEIIISPRTEEDKKQFKEDLKRYKANKEKLKRQKEKILLQTKKQLREIELKKAKDKRPKTVKVKLKDKPDFNSEAAKKIKETFRTNMASTVVSSLNVYRKPDCTEGRITNTQDFKHLARKLTHFVMLKEMKHITKIEELTCTDNVKMKAREFIRKYMNKFGEVYIKRSDSPDFKD